MRGTVIIADDHDDLRTSLTEMLTEAGYRTLEASNGHEAIKLARGISQPGLMIVDLVMPELNGWDLITLVQQDASLRWLPMIIVTGFPRKSPPGILVIRKPFDPMQLFVSVARLCL